MSVSPAGVGSPNLLAQALPSPLSWASPVSDYNDDFLSRYVASLTPGTGFPRTSTPVPINTPPGGCWDTFLRLDASYPHQLQSQNSQKCRE